MRRASIALLFLLWPGVAHAQDAPVVVLSIGGDAPAATARQARDAVSETLMAEGARVLPEANVAMRIPPSRLEACERASCAYALARELEASAAAAVTVWMGESGPRTLSVSLIVSADRSYSASEEVGDGSLRDAARRAVAGAHAAQGRAALIEGPSAARASGPGDADAGQSDGAPDGEQASVLRADRSLEEWILPSILGVTGLALVGLSVYALLEEQCELRGPSGVCLAGSAPNIGLGVTFAIAGALAVAGGIIWLIVGGQPPPMGDIDVVLGPEGGGVTWRGRF